MNKKIVYIDRGRKDEVEKIYACDELFKLACHVMSFNSHFILPS